MKHKLLATIVLIVITASMIGAAAIIAPYVRKGETTLPVDEPLHLTVMSYNIRTVNLKADRNGPDYWDTRKKALVDHIRTNDPDILGAQEVLAGIQDYYLKENLPEYSAVGFARDGAEIMFLSEKNLIFYKTDKFELLDSDTFWLSNTPDKVSKGWDANLRRICTYALLKDKATGKTIMFFNTHFDHKGAEARQKSAAMLAKRVSDCKYPAILTGDFNFYETDTNYENMTLSLDDTKYIADSTMMHATYHGYSDADLSHKPPIDFCMVTKDDFKVQSYEVLTGKHLGVFTSDHFAVKVRLSL